jgi:hypothetical protein
MKFFSILAACAGLAVAFPTIDFRQSSAVKNKTEICKERGWDKVVCDFQEGQCLREGEMASWEDDQLRRCLKVRMKKCENDDECGDGFWCKYQFSIVPEDKSCQPILPDWVYRRPGERKEQN